MRNVENNVFVIYVIVEKVNVIVLWKYIVYNIKKLFNKKVV